MFERFTDKARETIVRSLEDRSLPGRPVEVTPSNVLLGALAIDTTRRVLQASGIDPERLRRRVADVALGEPRTDESKTHVPFTSSARKVLEVAVAEAGIEGVPVCPEHLALAAMKVAAHEGHDYGVRLDMLTDNIRQAFAEGRVTSAQLEHSDVVLTATHSIAECRDPQCTLHRRTEHAMRDFPQTWRDDRGIMERTCPHGVGHPDPDGLSDGSGVHGCDGCCAPIDLEAATP